MAADDPAITHFMLCRGLFPDPYSLSVDDSGARVDLFEFVRLESIKLVLGIIIVLLFYRHGVTALAWSVVLMTGISYFINVWFNVKLLGYRWRMQAFDILSTFLLCAVAGLAAWWLATFDTGGPIVVLLVQSVTFVTFVGSGVVLLRKIFFIDIWGHLLWGISWGKKGSCGDSEGLNHNNSRVRKQLCPQKFIFLS